MSSEIDKGYSTALWDFGIVGLMMLVAVLALFEGTRPIAIALGVGLPSTLGAILLFVGLIDMFVKGGGDKSSFFYLGVFALTGAICAMGQSAGTRQMAILLGIAVPWGVGLVVFLIVGAMSLVQTISAQHNDQDFSSFLGAEEQSFLGQERNMRDNAKSANLIGFGLAGVLFLVGVVVVAGLYTPCYRYCRKPPTACKNEKQIADWRAGCDASCERLERESGLQVLRQITTEAGEKRHQNESVSGREYVEALDACNFANGAGATCEKIVDKATSVGLWCPETKD